jgi:pyruvate formate lyase activating enzyme
MSKLEIKGFIETSLCDWDGLISSVIFLPECNFRCPFCQNGDLILSPEALPSIRFDCIAGYLEAHRDWIDGVVLTGGEPTIWAELKDLAGELKTLGFRVKLDTNGTGPAEIERLIGEGLIDYIAMDVKAPLDERYKKACGVSVDLGAIRRSIDLVRDFGDAYEFRTTLVPGLVGEEEVELIAQSIRGAERYALQRFVPENSLDNSLRRAVPYGDGFVSRLVETAGKYVRSCFYRGKVGVSLS